MLISVTVIIFFLLLLNEIWWRRRKVHNEFSRKFIHLTVGCFVAAWPFILSWRQIQLLSLAFVIVILISKHFKIFQAIHSVQRPTWGEIFFAVSVGLITLLTHNKWIYAAAALQMGLADGLAAIVGSRYGWQRYKIFSSTKSIVGSLTFFITSVIILLAYNHFSHNHLSLTFIALASLSAALLENISIVGV